MDSPAPGLGYADFNQFVNCRLGLSYTEAWWDDRTYSIQFTTQSNGTVPEPSAFALLGFGLMGLLTWRRVRID